MVSIFSSPWPGSLNQLKDELLNQRIKVSAMFDPEGTGSIKIDDLFLVALLNALPDKHFSYPKDKIFAENTANTIPDLFRTLETRTNFDNYKTTLSHDSAMPSTRAGPTALVAVTPSTSTSKYVMYQKNSLPLFPAIPKDHLIIVTHATRSAVTHRMAQLQLHPSTLQPDLRLSLLLHATIQIDPRRNDGVVSEYCIIE